jgi:hypothetical protein
MNYSDLLPINISIKLRVTKAMISLWYVGSCVSVLSSYMAYFILM